jgi:hypothetical protein
MTSRAMLIEHPDDGSITSAEDGFLKPISRLSTISVVAVYPDQCPILLADAALKLLENGTFFFDRTRARKVRQLIGGLGLRERTLVLLDAGTGLRMSELFV